MHRSHAVMFSKRTLSKPLRGQIQRNTFFSLNPAIFRCGRNLKKREQDVAFLVARKIKMGLSTRDPKMPYLPFRLDGVQWACDFRNGTMVKLSILDLASFRPDGRVRVDEGAFLLPRSFLLVNKVSMACEPRRRIERLRRRRLLKRIGIVDFNLQLSFVSNEPFNHIHCGTFEPGSRTKANGVWTTYPKRVTWRLRRCGRIRMPYAAALLDQYVRVMSRQAFDLDYMTPGFGDGETPIDQAKASRAAEEKDVPDVPPKSVEPTPN